MVSKIIQMVIDMKYKIKKRELGSVIRKVVAAHLPILMVKNMKYILIKIG